ncbi:MAG: DegT/DnrJ/EryC1/StrS family aminotransferase [Polyangiaceae bacterium]|nr:DegT/DnrJ/EryC1/StrS family aminotransferase [Polyangiaceae bacterium]
MRRNLNGSGEPSASGQTTLEALECGLAAALGAEYAVVTGSGRSALEIAVRSLERRAGSAEGTILCSDFTCSIVPQTIAKAGFRPVLVDINKDLSFNIDSVPDPPADCRAIVLNYLYGCPLDDIDRVKQYVALHNLQLIEDVAQSFGARIHGTPAGSVGDVGVFSFPKVFFELRRGGCLVTNRPELATRARALRARIESPIPAEAVRFAFRVVDGLRTRLGRLRDQVQPAPDPFTLYGARPYHYFEETHPSLRWQLSPAEIESCAASVRDLDASKRERARRVKAILQHLEDELGGLFTLPAPYSSDYVYSKVPLVCARFDRRALKPLLQSAGISIGMDYIPLHNNSALGDTFLSTGGSDRYAVSDYYAQHLLPVPVTASVHEVLAKALCHLC